MSENELVVQQQTGAMLAASDELPEFLRGGALSNAELGKEDLSLYVMHPRMKIVQKSARRELLEKFAPGDVILSPQLELVAAIDKLPNGLPGTTGAVFTFVPLYFYSEFCCWNPMGHDDLPVIHDRTFNRKSELAQKCMRVTHTEPATKADGSPVLDKKTGLPALRKFHEHLNFIVLFTHRAELTGIKAVMSFSRGNFTDGKELAALCMMRVGVPLWCNQFCGNIRHDASNPEGDYFRPKFYNPLPNYGIGRYVADEAQAEYLKQLRNELHMQHQAALLRVDYTETDVTAGKADAAEEVAF